MWKYFTLLVRNTFFSGVQETLSPAELGENTIRLVTFIQKAFEKEECFKNEHFIEFMLLVVNMFIIPLSMNGADKYFSKNAKILDPLIEIIAKVNKHLGDFNESQLAEEGNFPERETDSS